MASHRDSSLGGIDIHQKTGFCNPTTVSIQLVCVLFETHHTLRNDFGDMIRLSVEDGDLSDLQARTRFLTRRFAEQFQLFFCGQDFFGAQRSISVLVDVVECYS